MTDITQQDPAVERVAMARVGAACRRYSERQDVLARSIHANVAQLSPDARAKLEAWGLRKAELLTRVTRGVGPDGAEPFAEDAEQT